MSKQIIDPIKVEAITVTTDGSGNSAVKSANIVNGEILKIAYDKGTVGAATTVALTSYTPLVGTVREAIDSYNVNTASVNRYPYAAITGAVAGDNKWAKFAVNDYLLATVTSGDTSKTFTVYVFYR
jgi:hypothetical protein